MSSFDSKLYVSSLVVSISKTAREQVPGKFHCLRAAAHLHMAAGGDRHHILAFDS
jgi:hypothetical protein